jgi:hypothetical protein
MLNFTYYLRRAAFVVRAVMYRFPFLPEQVAATLRASFRIDYFLGIRLSF